MKFSFVSFFAGIGGIDLGLEWAGHKCVGQIENEPYCVKVLEHHWPNVWRYNDIRTLKPEEIPQADLWTAGFPCQDISSAGRREGIRGERSGLFFDFMRLVRVVRPEHILLENVAALLVRGRGMDAVLGELSESGYDAEWDSIPAAAVGARHLRNRVFIVASPRKMDHADCFAQGGVERYPCAVRRWCRDHRIRRCIGRGPWAAESGVDRTAYGIPRGLDRKCLCGNAVVPQVAQFLGKRLAQQAEAAE